jgi:hypothetical protein
MDLIERIGPFLGILAFLGLATVAFLIFQQAREVRRLREWAGRAPERAKDAADASLAAAEARGEVLSEPEEPAAPGRLSGLWSRIADPLRDRFAAVDRRLPVDGRYLLAVALVAVVAAGVLTSGFGLVGGEGGKGGHHGRHGGGKEAKPEVAVLNGTTEQGIQGVPGLANTVATQVVKPEGYHLGPVTNTSSSFANTVVMFSSDKSSDAKALASAVDSKLGSTPTQSMSPEITALAHGAPLALVIGLDDKAFGQ